MANTFLLAQNMGPTRLSLPLSLLAVGPTVDVAPSTVAVAVDVACPTSAVDVAASTTSSRYARRPMRHF
jgi:hypothetical protein